MSKIMLLSKAVGQFKNSGKYYLSNGRWRSLHPKQKKPKAATMPDNGGSAGSFVPKQQFADNEWDQLKLAETNSNAGTFNRQLASLKAQSDAGDVDSILGARYGTNTYGKRLATIANKLLEMYGTEHRVTAGQKTGEHTAIAATDDMPLFNQPKATSATKVSPVPVTSSEDPGLPMPEFKEGKTTTSVVSHYEKVAQKVIDLTAAGDADALQELKADGLKPSSKGKVGNTWAGRTANSKALLSLYDEALSGLGVKAEAKPRQIMLFPKADKPVPKIVPETVPSKETAQAIDAAASQAKTNPTDAQKEAGNYKKGHITVQGMSIAIENARGDERSGTDKDGNKWTSTMSDHYGYLKGTNGADGDHVDVYVGANPQSDQVFVIDQVDENGSFDEHKVMLGFDSQKQATDAYLSNFDKGWKLGDVTGMPISEFKEWLKDGDHKKPMKSKAPAAAKAPAAKPSKQPDTGPKEGDTKQGADGTLTLKDGRWRKEDDGLSNDPNSPNYRFKDTGYISGSRKEQAAADIRKAAREGVMIRKNSIDWKELETNPREAAELIKKSNLFGKVDWEGLKDEGMQPATGFLIDRVYASIAPSPEDNAQAREDYSLAIESIRARMEGSKAPEDVLDVLSEIRDEMEGVMMSASESEMYKASEADAHALWLVAKEAKEAWDGAYNKWNSINRDLNSAKVEQQNRVRRKWRADPEIELRVERLTAEDKLAEAAFREYQAAHPEMKTQKRETPNGFFSYRNELETAYDNAKTVSSMILAAVRQKNMNENPMTRAWLSLGPRFVNTIGWRRGKSAAFAGHVTNAKNGKINDWSWAEKAGSVRKPTKREVQFQLAVAENYERKGGREVSVSSTEALKTQFNLREVQSGNWVLSDANSAGFHVQKCSEAFADLADIIGVPDELVSMNGRLAMAFGARGQGNAGFGGAARAHYEPIQRVINLTKMGGGGALAHEWLHALDNLVYEAEGLGESTRDTFLTETPELLPEGELKDAFTNLKNEMRTGSVRMPITIEYTTKDHRLAKQNVPDQPRSEAGKIIKAGKNAGDALINLQDYFAKKFGSANLSKRTQKNINDWRKIAVAYHDDKADGGKVTVKAGAKVSSFMAESVVLDGGKNGKYWSEGREMAARAFQSYVEDKLESQDRRNDYLSALADNKYHKDPIFGDAKPFPEGEERIRINAAFDKLMQAMVKRGTLAKAMALL